MSFFVPSLVITRYLQHFKTPQATKKNNKSEYWILFSLVLVLTSNIFSAAPQTEHKRGQQPLKHTNTF